jgi:hypothetical protein
LIVACCCHIVLWMFCRELSRDVGWKFTRMKHPNMRKEKSQAEPFYTAWTYEHRMDMIRCRGLQRWLCVARKHTPRHTPALRHATRDWLIPTRLSRPGRKTPKLSTSEKLIPEDRTIFTPWVPSCQECIWVMGVLFFDAYIALIQTTPAAISNITPLRGGEESLKTDFDLVVLSAANGVHPNCEGTSAPIVASRS